MSLLRFEDIRLEFGEQVILRDAEFSIEPGERVCLIGRNGAGKSTTLKLIMGEMEPDHGAIVPKVGLIVSQLRQNLPDALDLPVREVIRSGLKMLPTCSFATRSCRVKSWINTVSRSSKICTRRLMRLTAGTSTSASIRR